jgi:hypothetical protein
VGERGIALACRCREEGVVERDDVVAQLHVEAPVLDVDRCHLSPFAVGDAEAGGPWRDIDARDAPLLYFPDA